MSLIKDLSEIKLAIIGLGYVGLPLAVEFGKRSQRHRLRHQRRRASPSSSAGHDATLEVSDEELARATACTFTTDAGRSRALQRLTSSRCRRRSTTHKRPDLTPLDQGVSETVGKVTEARATSSFTSRPSIPAPPRKSACRARAGLRPQVQRRLLRRLQPRAHQPRRQGAPRRRRSRRSPPARRRKSPSSSTRSTQRSSPPARIKAASIKVAEAAKVIENTQRDLNIALINELALIFNRLGIDTEDVLEAAGTKWNFLPFRPGLVGGHCIGVDPYYLTHKAQELGYHPEIILAGRRINDGMGAYVGAQLVKAMIKRRIQVEGARILILGLTFKENCPDLRNTRVVDIVRELADYNVERRRLRSLGRAAPKREHEYGVDAVAEPQPAATTPSSLAVAHDEFSADGGKRDPRLGKAEHVLYDLKYILRPEDSDLRL